MRERYANDPEYREKCKANARKYHNSPEHRERMKSQEYRERRSEIFKKYYWGHQENKPIRNQKLREKRLNDPEWRERENAKNRTPEARDRINKRYRERYATEPEFRENHKAHSAKYGKIIKERIKTVPLVRAKMLCYRYKNIDKNRGFDTTNNITGSWLYEKFCNSSCIYCGDSDWRHLGADRIDNNKPHTPDNVVCSCGICNAERAHRYTVEEFIEYRKTHPRNIEQSNPMLCGYETTDTGALKKKQVPGTLKSGQSV